MPDLWPCGEMRAHCTPKQYQRLIRWKGVEWASTYTEGIHGPVLGYDVMFSSDLTGRIRKFLSGGSVLSESGAKSYKIAT